MPSGQELMKIASAVERPLFANQSSTSLVIRTLITTPPTPETTRPAIAASSVVACATIAPPASISARLAITVRLSPKRVATAPPPTATTIPGPR